MDVPRALVFRPLVKGNEALGTRLLNLVKRRNDRRKIENPDPKDNTRAENHFVI